MNIASIDVGTNTVLLLIASVNNFGEITPLINEYRVPRIGKNVRQGLPILPEKIEELITILREYKALSEKYNCSVVIAYGTNALRIASNTDEIIDYVKSSTGIDIEVISGEDEARYGFMGAVSGIDSHHNLVVLDIGGGSTELIIGDKSGHYSFRQSFPVGVVMLTEKFNLSLSHSKSSINSSEEYLANIFKPIEKLASGNSMISAIGGTPTSLYCIKNNLNIFDESIIEGKYLNTKDLSEINDYLIKTDHVNILQSFDNVVKGREDLLLAGSLILQKVVSILHIEKVRVTTRGLRYGMVCDFASKTFGKYSVV